MSPSPVESPIAPPNFMVRVSGYCVGMGITTGGMISCASTNNRGGSTPKAMSIQGVRMIQLFGKSGSTSSVKMFIGMSSSVFVGCSFDAIAS